MESRARREPEGLVVTFERDGAEALRVAAADGHKAVIKAVRLLLAHQKLQAGDRLTVSGSGAGVPAPPAARHPISRSERDWSNHV